MTGGLVAATAVLAAALTLGALAAGRGQRTSQLAPRHTSPGPPRWFRQRLGAADDLDTSRLWVLWLAGVPVSFSAGHWLAGGGAGIASALAWLSLPLLMPSWLERRRIRRRDEALPFVLDAVARSLRSGASLLQALGEAAAEPGTLQRDLRALVAEAERGAGLDRALQAWAEAQPPGPLRLGAAALGMSAEMGGATARTVEGVAATVRQRLEVAGESRALTSQARISAQVIALAPLGFCAIGAATDPELARFLFVTPVGWAFLVSGALLDLAGAAWMRRLAGT